MSCRPKNLAYFNERLEEELQTQKDREELLTGDTKPGQSVLQGDAEWAAAEDVSFLTSLYEGSS